jgi:hypothetical protein
MANVYIEVRPKDRPTGSPIEEHVVEDHSKHVLTTFKTQREGVRTRRQDKGVLICIDIKNNEWRLTLTQQLQSIDQTTWGEGQKDYNPDREKL